MNLNASELAEVSRLLDEALALDAADHERWLEALPEDVRRLAPLLRDLLAHAQEGSASPLDKPPQLGERRGAERPQAGEPKDGDRVGPYQLVRELGTGGMAEVWLARRADGAYKREVALKLPKPARSRKDLGRLFARERDIQASLEHPNIARLYDAGVSSEGLPYLAMEFVQGHPLTAWCDARRVGLRERLQLFLQVTDAVEYAHARHIIHRDLKPSNILVDGTGQVRLLDFGIAKLLAEEESDRIPVHFYARALTPDYASPELLRGDPVDAASDVYSLGAVLYELLSGNRPYRLARGVPAAQLARTIIGAGVAKPSARLAPGAGLARATTQERLAGRLRGDLDAVALKALASAPADRYRNVAAFAADVRRYLGGEPVAALPDRLTAAELVDALSRNPNVRVKARAAAPAPDESPQPAVRDAASTPSRPTLRVTVEVIDIADGKPVWSHSRDIDACEVAAQGDGVARSLASAVRQALDDAAAKAVEKSAKST